MIHSGCPFAILALNIGNNSTIAPYRWIDKDARSKNIPNQNSWPVKERNLE